jgi:hypothetical protein
VSGDLEIRGHTVGQFPNPPLWVAFAAFLVALLTDGDGTVDDVARAVAYIAFAVWAYREAAEGVNRFRRALGVVALLLIVLVVARALD